MHMEPEQFVKEYLVEYLHAEYLAVGPIFVLDTSREILKCCRSLERVRIYCGNCGKGKDGSEISAARISGKKTEKGNMEKSMGFGIYLFYQRRLSMEDSLKNYRCSYRQSDSAGNRSFRPMGSILPNL